MPYVASVLAGMIKLRVSLAGSVIATAGAELTSIDQDAWRLDTQRRPGDHAEVLLDAIRHPQPLGDPLAMRSSVPSTVTTPTMRPTPSAVVTWFG